MANKWTKEDRIRALLSLAKNAHDFNKAADETGIPASTIRHWWHTNGTMVDQQAEEIPELGDVLERVIREILKTIPKMTGKEWSTTVGILIDKYLLIQGQPTSRTEMITTKLGGVSPDEFEDILEEANRIIEEASSRSFGESLE